jgi:predicted nucleic acid-binding protein
VRVFVDTGALLALSHARDQHHRAAAAIATRNRAAGVRYVGSALVLGEFYSHLLYLRGPSVARASLARLIDDPAHDWQGVPPDVVRAASARWLSRFPDQAFSLIDAVSFEIMSREKLKVAFAFDHHFEVAGFSLAR